MASVRPSGPPNFSDFRGAGRATVILRSGPAYKNRAYDLHVRPTGSAYY